MKNRIKKIRKQRKSLFHEFKQFITRGNVIDLAVGMIIGSAFTAIVGSLVNDIFMPIVSFFIGKTQFSDLAIVLIPDKLDASGEVIEKGVSLTYGKFIQSVVNFLIIAIVVFIIAKVINSIRKKLDELEEKAKKEAEAKKQAEEKKEPTEEAKPVEVVVPPEIALLTEIRDLLKKE